jgi:hypothetical protein
MVHLKSVWEYSDSIWLRQSELHHSLLESSSRCAIASGLEVEIIVTTPRTTPRFEGTIARTVVESEPWWPETEHPAEGTPNVVMILLDDTCGVEYSGVVVDQGKRGRR